MNREKTEVAVAELLQHLTEDPVARTTLKRIQIHFPIRDVPRLDRESARIGISRSEVIRRAVAEFLDRRDEARRKQRA